MPRLRAALVLAVLASQLAVAAGGAAGKDPVGRHRVLLGRSVDGRPIVAVESGDFDSPERVLVVGCIHGNEPAGVAVASRLAHDAPPRGLDLWIVPVLNPDGVAAGTRGNADGVDLNRNYPWRWRRLGGVYDSGRHPLSEPESRVAALLIERLNPQLSIWFHQHLGVVDESGGDIAVERRFAELSGLPLVRLAREPGSVVGWENHRDPASTAFVVELRAGRLSPDAVRRLDDAVRDLVGSRLTA